MRRTYCEDCNKDFNEVTDCACGLPFCDDCYEWHVTDCPDALEAIENDHEQTNQ